MPDRIADHGTPSHATAPKWVNDLMIDLLISREPRETLTAERLDEWHQLEQIRTAGKFY